MAWRRKQWKPRLRSLIYSKRASTDQCSYATGRPPNITDFKHAHESIWAGVNLSHRQCLSMSEVRWDWTFFNSKLYWRHTQIEIGWLQLPRARMMDNHETSMVPSEPKNQYALVWNWARCNVEKKSEIKEWYWSHAYNKFKFVLASRP